MSAVGTAHVVVAPELVRVATRRVVGVVATMLVV